MAFTCLVTLIKENYHSDDVIFHYLILGEKEMNKGIYTADY